jgi:parallel beta-helix repeat protein
MVPLLPLRPLRLLPLWGLLLGALALTLTCHTRARAGVAATTRYVSNSGNDINPGTDRNFPKQHIEAAIGASMTGDTVIVLDGTYTGEGNKDLDYSIGLVMGTRNITVKSENGPLVTLIDCQGAGRGFLFESGETAAARVEGFTIRNGRATSGGGMFILASDPTLVNCIFSGNTAASTFSQAFGGGIAIVNSSSATVTNCTFSGNTAVSGLSQAFGGGIAIGGGSPTVVNCTFSGNTAVTADESLAAGGGMGIVSSGSPTVVNCTFSGNAAQGVPPWGGGMFIDNSSPTVVNCTFSGNTASGMYIFSGNPTVTNSILWGNSPNQISGTAFVTYSDVQGGFAGTGNLNADPLFVRNPSPGMDGRFGDHPFTMVDEAADDDYGDLHLQAASPVIDAGNNAPVTAPPFPADGGGTVLDKDGKPRFVDHPGKADTGAGTAPIVDMGAFEFAPLPRPISLTLTNSSVTGGGLVGGRVTLDRPAPMGGVVLTFSSAPAGASVAGGTVTVPAGQTTFPAAPNWFTIQTTPQGSNTTVQLKVAANGGEATTNLLIKAPYVWRIRFTPSPTKKNQGTVLFGELTGPLPAGGAMIPLTSTNQMVFANRVVNVAAGAQTFTVNFTPTVVGSATVTATFPAGKTASALLVVNP